MEIQVYISNSIPCNNNDPIIAYTINCSRYNDFYPIVFLVNQNFQVFRNEIQSEERAHLLD